MIGRSTSIIVSVSVVKNDAVVPAPPSTLNHASLVCTVPRYQLVRKFASGGVSGTAQYAVRLIPGTQTHLSAIVLMGRDVSVASFEVRRERKRLSPVSVPIRSALEPVRGRMVRPGILRTSGASTPPFPTS